MGDGGMSEGRFRDPNCFIPDQKASRYEDKDFAVNREEDALASAVLDLQQDDAVSSCLSLIRGSYKSDCQGYWAAAMLDACLVSAGQDPLSS